MKTNNLILIAALFMSLLLFGCGGTDSETIIGDIGTTTGATDTGGTTPVTPPVDDTPTEQATPVDTIVLEAASSAIGTGQSTALLVTLYNANGLKIGGEKEVTFTLDNPAVGWIESPLTVIDGVALHAFNARSTQGTVTITSTVDGKTAQQTIQISDQPTATQITMGADKPNVATGGTAGIMATVLDENGQLIPDGAVVNFTVDDPTLGSLSPTTASTTNGVAQVTFSADGVGTARITASSGTAENSLDFEVTDAGPGSGSIEFFSAVPQVIVIQGAGGQETSEIKFLIKDSNGDPIASSQTVDLVLSGPNGGEYLGSDSTATELIVSTVDGFATAILHSGTIPGTVTISASVAGTNLSTSSGVISIGGGVPSAGHFSLSTTRLNVEGRSVDGVMEDITARIADRYGNYNVLEGSSVSFYSECGAIDTATQFTAEGEGTVVFRTQTPEPQDVDADNLGSLATLVALRDSCITGTSADCLAFNAAMEGSCGDRCTEENYIIFDFYDKFGFDITAGTNTNNPRDGLCTIVSVIEGEEEFTDNNADGLYDSGEPFVDTYDDIHLDMDDDEFDLSAPYAAGFPYDAAFEDLIVDRGSDGGFDGLNGSWDANKRIGKTINLLFTGAPMLTLSSGSFTLLDGESKTIYFAVHDSNYNQPIAGSKVTVTLDKAALSGNEAWEFGDTNQVGTPIFSVTVSDATPGDTEPSETAKLQFVVEWPAETGTVTTTYSMSVTVN